MWWFGVTAVGVLSSMDYVDQHSFFLREAAGGLMSPHVVVWRHRCC